MIEVRNLTKTFGSKTAVNGVSFQVGKGEVLGFLGPNGAGKSTTMRIIAGFLPADSGRVTVGGMDVQTDPIGVKRQLGYLPENAPSYSDMDVEGFLKFAASVRGLEGTSLRQAVDKAVETCFLASVRRQSIDTLSKGYRHRVCLAQAIIHDPPALILDEPTDGLDPNQKHEVRTLIRRMGETKAIIFSTHILEEVEAACSRAIIIDNGQVVASGTPSELKARSEEAGRITLTLCGGQAKEIQDKLKSVEGVDHVDVISSEPPVFRIVPKKGNSGVARAVATCCRESRFDLETLSVEEGRLDDVFRTITSPDRKEAAK